MGYYPTPPDVAERIGSFLRYPEGNVNLLDPCCGEGLALSTLADGAHATTYGIELDGHRAELAKQNLDHVLKCSYEDTRISNNAFSCLFLNPPYDWEKREAHQLGLPNRSAEYACPSRELAPSGVGGFLSDRGRRAWSVSGKSRERSAKPNSSTALGGKSDTRSRQ